MSILLYLIDIQIIIYFFWAGVRGRIQWESSSVLFVSFPDCRRCLVLLVLFLPSLPRSAEEEPSGQGGRCNRQVRTCIMGLSGTAVTAPMHRVVPPGPLHHFLPFGICGRVHPRERHHFQRVGKVKLRLPPNTGTVFHGTILPVPYPGFQIEVRPETRPPGHGTRPDGSNSATGVSVNQLKAECGPDGRAAGVAGDRREIEYQREAP